MKKLTKLAILGIIVVVVGLSGCTAKIDIVGNGDVLSESGSRNCYLETTDCQETVTGAFQETFTAVPRAGYEFEGWDYCERSTGNVCTFDVSAATVQKAWNQSLPAVVARFVPVSDTSLKVETVEILVNSCDASDVLPYERHCAPRIGTFLTTALRPDNGTLTVFDWSNIPYQGAYVVTDGGWSYTGIYHFDAAVHTMSITATGDSVIMTKWVNGDSVNYYMRIEGTL